MKTLVIAIGGNSLITNAQHMSVPDQYAAVVKTVHHITDLLEQRHRIVITHGNGPQVGFILLRRDLKKSAVTVVTQTLVNRDDAAFASPGKPIGEFYTREQAEDRMRVEKWTMMEDAGRGWRRVVASPIPVRIIESKVVRHLVKDGYVVI